MTYNSGTDSYQADFLENILDTTYKYGVPYIIDREKYESVMKEFKKEMRIKDADIVVFHANYDKKEDREAAVLRRLPVFMHLCETVHYIGQRAWIIMCAQGTACPQFDYSCNFMQIFNT